MLLRHASMQKIRHCCENLNLLPFLLYSFDNSKSNPIVRKMYVYLNCLLREITLSLLNAYQNLRHSVNEIRVERSSSEQEAQPTTDNLARFLAAFNKSETFKKPKRKSQPFYLVAAAYLVPFLLFCQIITLCSLTIVSKYMPGFFFLIVALLFLGGIALKILMHQKTHKVKQEKNKKRH